MINKKLLLTLTILATFTNTAVAESATKKALQDRYKRYDTSAALAADLTTDLKHTADLLVSINKDQLKLKSEKPFDINVVDVDIRTFAANVSSEKDISVVVHPDVDLTITLQLRNTTLSKAFYIIGDAYNLDVRLKNNVYFIYPATLRTETFNLSYINVERNGSSNIQVNTSGLTGGSGGSGGGNNGSGNNGGGNNNSNQSNNSNQNNNSGSSGGQNLSNGTTINTNTKIDVWEDINETLQTLIGDNNGRKVVVSPQTGTITVKGYPSDFKSIREYLHEIEFFLNKQVVLEARIIEVTLNEQFKQGIDWNYVNASSSRVISANSLGTIAGNQVSAAIGGLTNLTFSTPNFTNVIDLLSTQGDAQTLSSPRITATNNQKAVIKVGEDEYYVTEVSTTTTTGTSTTTTPEINLEPFFSGISLDVTPHINKSGDILLHVHPSVIETNEKEKIVTLNEEQYILPLAQSSVRETDTVIRARTNEIVLIGGLIQTKIEDIESGIPLLKDLPFLGPMFTSSSQVEVKKELIILIRPTLIDSRTRSDAHKSLFED